MKPMNTMFKLTALACALTASLSAYAGGGGDGGKIQAETGMDSNYIAKNIARSKDPAFYALQALEYDFHVLKFVSVNAPWGPLYQKLFAGPRTIFQALNEAKFVPTYDEHVCDGLPEKDPDACAFPKTNTVYFILPRIEKKEVKDQSGNFQLVALVAHEAVHLVEGTTEEDALFIQGQVQTNVSSKIYEAFPQLPAHVRGSIENADNLTKNLVYNLPKSNTQLCDQLYMIFESIGDATNTDSESKSMTGIVILSNRQTWASAAAVAKTMNLWGNACPIPHGQYSNDTVFKDKTSMSMLDYYKAAMNPGSNFPDAGYDSLPNVTVRRVNKDATAAIKAELLDITNLLDKVQAGLK